MPQTVSPLEVAWTVINLVGMVRWLQRYWANVRDRRKIDRDSMELAPDRVVANIRCIRSIMVADGLEAYAGVGWLLMDLPSGPVTDPQEPSAWVLALLMFFVPVALIITGEVFDSMEVAMANLLREYQRISGATR